MNAKNEARCKFPHWRRLRSSQDYARVYAGKVRAGDNHLLVFADCNTTGKTRIGLSVSRKNGNSIVRHRLRRLIREAFRLSQSEIPEGFDFVCIPRADTVSTVSDYQSSLLKLTCKLAKQLLKTDNKTQGDGRE